MRIKPCLLAASFIHALASASGSPPSCFHSSSTCSGDGHADFQERAQSDSEELDRDVIQTGEVLLQTGHMLSDSRAEKTYPHQRSHFSPRRRMLESSHAVAGISYSSAMSSMLNSYMLVSAPADEKLTGSTGIGPCLQGLSYATLVIAIFILGHELKVFGGRAPLLAGWAKRTRRPLQTAFCLVNLEIFNQCMFLVAVSYDLADFLGKGVLASAFILCAGSFTFPIGAGMAKKAIGDESNWNQGKLRRQIIRNLFVMALLNLLLGFQCRFTFLSKEQIFWSVLANRALWGVFNGNTFVINQTMMIRAVPPSERTVFGLAVVATRNLGLLIGPLISSLALILSSMVEAPATNQILAVVLLEISVSMGTMLSYSLMVPANLEQVEDTEEERAADLDAITKGAPEQLPDECRRKMVWLLGGYSIERNITMSAVEVSSVLLFEIEYGLNSTESGIYMTISGCVAAVTCSLFAFLLAKKVVREPDMLILGCITAFLGGLCLFDVGGSKMLVFADTLIYSFCSVAGGIAEGWATRAAKEGTDFNLATYRVFLALGISISRIIVPPVARSLVDMGGRNAYAAAQNVVTLLGCYTIGKAIWLRSHALMESAGEATMDKFEAKEQSCRVDKS